MTITDSSTLSALIKAYRQAVIFEEAVPTAFKVAKMPVVGLATRQCFLIKGGKIVWHDAKASTDKQAEDIKRELAQK